LTDASATRRATGEGPEERTFQPKPQFAGAMIRALSHEGIGPFKEGVADGRDGNATDVLEAVEAWAGLTSGVAIPAATRCGLQGPVMEAKPYTSKGAVRSKRTVVSKDSHPPTVKAMAPRRHEPLWSRRPVAEGTQGPMAYAVTNRRGTRCRDGLPDRAVGLLSQRPRGAAPSYWYDLSNAPRSPRFPTFVGLSGVRWAIEPGVEDAQTALGMAPDEVRKDAGWHHHRLTCIRAHCFVWHVTIRVGEKSPGLAPVPEADGSGGDLAVAPGYA
jgi:SRSO17 transposase